MFDFGNIIFISSDKKTDIQETNIIYTFLLGFKCLRMKNTYAVKVSHEKNA